MVRGHFIAHRLMRRAFTMIELIFAIVVIAVVMLTIPMMIQVNNKALEGSAAQEAIFLVSAVLSETTTMVWDNRSIVGSDTGYSLSKILDVDAVGTTYGRTDVNSSIRVGGINEDLHRSFFDYNATSPAVPALADGQRVTLTHDINNSVANAAGYKSQFTIVATREYVDDTAHAGTVADPFVFAIPAPAAAPANRNNIKMTQVEINATIDGNTTTVARLRAYTCNIGEIDYAKRRF